MQFLLQKIENIVGKEKNADYQHFTPFPQCFQNLFPQGHQQASLCGLYRVLNYTLDPWHNASSESCNTYCLHVNSVSVIHCCNASLIEIQRLYLFFRIWTGKDRKHCGKHCWLPAFFSSPFSKLFFLRGIISHYCVL